MNKNYKYGITFLFLFLTNYFLFAEPIDIKKLKEQLPKLLGANNIGTEFVFGFHPCWEEMASMDNSIMIYVSSSVETEVRITIPYFSPDPIMIKKTKPNDITEFRLTPSTAQPYARGQGGLVSTLLPTQVFQGKGIILESDAPIIAYGVTRYMYTSDGFLAIPTHALGKEYVIASYRETADFKNQSLTPYADIIGVYPKTKVSFFFGGNGNSRIRTTDTKIWKPFEVLRTELNRGDFWLIASEGAYSDLGGSFVIASQPVSVLSGNHCAYVPTSYAACDFIIEQESPTNTWGKKYHVSPIFDRKKASVIRVFAKDGPTTVYRDGVEQFTLFSNWGLQDDAWRELRANPDSNKAVVYHSDKPIYVVQYNTGQQDDGVSSDPFQLVLTAEEQFQKEIIFNTPGVRGGFGFQRNYLNIIFRSDFNNQIPDDLELGELLVTGETQWKKVKDISSSPGQQFFDPDLFGSQSQYYSKTIKLPYDAVYRLRAKNQKIAAYAYGFANYDSYGFPTSMAIFDMEKVDSLPPNPYYALTCDGNTIDKKTFVADYPDNDTVRSNLALVLFDKNSSYNYDFKIDNFIPGEDRIAKWSLRVIDPFLDAKAVLTFSDRKGNDTTITIEYFAVKLTIRPKNFYFGNVNLGEQKSQQFTITNESETSSAYLTELNIKTLKENLPSQNFDIYYSFDINEPILPKDTRNFFITFTAKTGGEFKDSIGVGDTCFFAYKTLVRANVGMPIINVADVDFGKVTVNTTTNPRIATISNTGTTAITITGYKDKKLKQFTHNLPVIDFENPLIIEKGGEYQFEITFSPNAVGAFNDTIIFQSDAGKNNDPYCIISGMGIEPQLAATSDDWGRKRVHVPRYDTIPYYKFTPYPSPSGAIILKNDGTKEVTINRLVVTENINGEAFEVYINGNYVPLINYLSNVGSLLDDSGKPVNIVQPGTSVHLPIFFHPKVDGVHVLKFDYDSDSPKKASTALSGIGIYPILRTNDVNFGSRIIGEPPTKSSFRFTNLAWEYQDSVTIQSIFELPTNSISPILQQTGTEGFSYDAPALLLMNGDTAHFPIVLQPGEYFEAEAAFSAVKIGNATALLRTNSDAYSEANSYWLGFGILEELDLIGPEEEYYCFDSKKEFVSQIINNGTIAVTLPPNSIKLINNDNSDFIIDRVTRRNSPPIDLFDKLIINPGDTIFVIVRFAPQNKPQSNVEEMHTCTLQVETTAVIPEARLLHTPISIRTIRYTRTTEAVINMANEITINPGRNIDLEPITYSLYVKLGPELEMANPLDFIITIKYEKSFLAINLKDKIHQIFPGSGLTSDWIVNDYTVNYDENTDIETVKIHLKGTTPFKSSKKQELLKIEFMVFQPWNKYGEDKSNSRSVTIYHQIESMLECVDFALPAFVIVNLEKTCDYEFRTITMSSNDYSLGRVNPNPVGASGTTISFSVPFEDFVEITLVNSLGEIIEKLVSSKLKPGKYELQLNSEKLTNGTYFVKMHSGEFNEISKFNLIK